MTSASRNVVSFPRREPRRRQHEIAFLPAALEITETPPSPVGRAIGATIIAAFCIALVWATLGSVDIVATATGKIVLSAAEAKERSAAGEDVLLLRRETNPDDLRGMVAARGILTSRGGKTSHAAVVARGMGKTCVCGADALEVDAEARTVRVAWTSSRRARCRSVVSSSPIGRTRGDNPPVSSTSAWARAARSS